MKSCNVGEEDLYRWGSPLFEEFFSGCIKFLQVLVAEYPNVNKILFEVEMDIDVLPVLPGSAISGYDGRPIPPIYKGAVVNTVMTEYVRVPNIEELDFYERYSKL